MAKQKGVIKIQGTIGDLTFVKTQDGYLVKEKTSLDGKRIATDAAFKRTRENNAEFATAGKAVKLLRSAVRLQVQNVKDSRMSSRLFREMMKVVKADNTSVRGQRGVLDAETEILQGFEFNKFSNLARTIMMPYSTNINRTAGTLEVAIPSFIPVRDIVAPQGATHFQIVSAGTEIDFSNEVFITDESLSSKLAIDNTATTAITLTNNVTANSTKPLFLLVGVLFYQHVNGVDYPLNNGVYNALSIVKVTGV